MSLLSSARRAWQAAPGSGELKLAVASRLYSTHLALARSLRRPGPQAALRPGPLIVSGFINDVIGIGRGAVATADALQALGLDVVRHDIRPIINSSPYVRAPNPGPPGGVWIHHCNPPETDLIFNHMPRSVAHGRYMIGYWAWELDHLPRAWQVCARSFHEIWAPSTFVANVIRPHARRVRVMPHPLRASPPATPARARFGLPEGAVVFAAFADARSSLARKNPQGALEAYLRAFPQADGRTALSIKLVGPEADAAGVAALKAAASHRPDVRIWTERLSEAEMARYLASVDVIVSLHRSEGFGLTIAEGYLAGRPAVATAWSGNLDFVEPEVRFGLTPAVLVPVQDASGRYRDGLWAEPDLDAAAKRMRLYLEEPAVRFAAASVVSRVEARLQTPWRRAELSLEPWFGLLAS